MSSSSNIIGPSHLVIATLNPDDMGRYLAKAGYQGNHYAPGLKNPQAKAPFIQGELSLLCDMVLFTSNNGLPPIELLSEPQATFAGTDQATAFEPLSIPDDMEGPIEIRVRCQNPAKAASFWRAAGGGKEKPENKAARLSFDRNIAAPAMDLVYVRSEEHPSTTWLNTPGLSAVSFLCRDASSLRDDLDSRGYECGEVFKIAPFGKKLSVFFARNLSREIYEFLSLDR